MFEPITDAQKARLREIACRDDLDDYAAHAIGGDFPTVRELLAAPESAKA